MIYERLLLTLLVAAVMGGASTHLAHRPMNEHDIVEEGYAEVVVALYKGLYDKLITNPPGDEHDAAANFQRGLTQARKARAIALESIHKDKD
jgi:hypothetical protein